MDTDTRKWWIDDGGRWMSGRGVLTGDLVAGVVRRPITTL